MSQNHGTEGTEHVSDAVDDASSELGRVPDEVQVGDLLDHLQQLETVVDSEGEREAVVHSIRLAERLGKNGVFGHRIEGYTTRDIAEAVIGSILISLPLLVEDGVFDIADHLLSFTSLGVPVWLAVNAVFVVVMTTGLLYWADIQRVSIYRPIFGLVPRRLLGVLLISMVTATLTMTMWGRVGNWEDPAVAIARISVIWTAAAFGAALGDILPGASKGRDISELVETLGDSNQ